MRDQHQDEPETPEALNRAERRARKKGGAKAAAHGQGKLHSAKGQPVVPPRQWANRRSG